MEGKIKIGPVGEQTYKSRTLVDWDEGSHSGIISQIFLSHGSTGILSIQFQFVIDDKFVLSDLHGRNSGCMFDVIALNWPHEYVTGVSGNISSGGSGASIKTLKITTNGSEYGPFGCSDINTKYMDKFDFNLGKHRQFGGFYGKYDAFGLQHIGVYLQPTTFKPKSIPKPVTSNVEETESKIVLG